MAEHHADDECLCLVDQNVLVGILDHAHTDPRNEIIGHLGGYYEPEENTVHVTLFSASVRIASEMDPSSVEGQPEEQLRAHEEFAARGLNFVGWYHSHPGDTQPRPSEKDVQMQTEMQNQIPHCVGIICSPHLKDNGSPEIAFNVFRTVLHMGEIKATNIEYIVCKTDLMSPEILEQMAKTYAVTLKEAEKIYQSHIDRLPPKSSEEKVVERIFKLARVKNNYKVFLYEYIRKCSLSMNLLLKQKVLELREEKMKLETKGIVQRESNNLSLIEQQMLLQPLDERENPLKLVINPMVTVKAEPVSIGFNIKLESYIQQPSVPEIDHSDYQNTNDSIHVD